MGLVARRNVDLDGLLDGFAEIPDLDKNKKNKKDTKSENKETKNEKTDSKKKSS